MNTSPAILSTYQAASIRKRFGAMLYDIFLTLAILFLATIPALILNDGKAVHHYLTYKLYLLLVWFGFHGYFWTRTGKTLGMQTWKIQIVNFEGQPITWKQAALRFISSGCGLANLWACIDKDHLGWHERLSKTVCIHTPQIH